jgi:SAM-dependent methyltransferase
MRRLSRFSWSNIEHDILKVLYESVIPAEQRKQLGEYYTPDWLAQHVVEETVKNPLKSRILDPSCGSGTFVFHAVKHYLEAADEAELDNSTAVAGVCTHVIGMDLHPVAVTLARVTYLLAIGTERLTADRGPISIPVFLGDSLQWGQEETLQTNGALVINADEDFGLFDNELRFPDSLLADAGTFDSLVSELADLASNRRPGSPVPKLDQLHHRFAMSTQDRETVRATFQVMCELSDQGRDHIWGYYVRNLARPRWLARKENRVDVLVGNPPWLSYRYMTRNMQTEFQQLCKDHGLWKGTKSATHVDLSSLFVMRCIERYLSQKGSFAFVLPFATLSRQHFEGFRKGRWPRPDGFPVAVKFLTAWDFHAVKPTFFEVPCCVARGKRSTERGSRAIPDKVDSWKGRLPSVNVDWETATEHLSRTKVSVKAAQTTEPASPYAERFYQGATLVPRMLCFVEKLPSGPLGRVSGEVSIRSRRSPFEKQPWKDLQPLETTVESNFVFPVHLGATILPYRPCEPLNALLPWDGKRLLHSGDEHLSRYPGLSRWWLKAEDTWIKNRSNDRLTLIENFDYMRKLTNQFWRATGMCAPIRAVYAASGMYIAAAVLTDPTVVVEHALYWATCRTIEEARYLCAVLNSESVTLAMRSFQARGEHNPRHYDKYIWQLAIPEYDPRNKLHKRLASLALEAEENVATLELPKTRFEKQRGFIRETLAPTRLGKSIETAARKLLKLR